MLTALIVALSSLIVAKPAYHGLMVVANYITLNKKKVVATTQGQEPRSKRRSRPKKPKRKPARHAGKPLTKEPRSSASPLRPPLN